MTNTRYTFTNARDFRDNAELQLFEIGRAHV